MFPFVFEWINDGSHFLFMGAFYSVIVVLVIILHYCGIRAVLDWLCKKEGHNEGHH